MLFNSLPSTLENIVWLLVALVLLIILIAIAVLASLFYRHFSDFRKTAAHKLKLQNLQDLQKQRTSQQPIRIVLYGGTVFLPKILIHKIICKMAAYQDLETQFTQDGWNIKLQHARHEDLGRTAVYLYLTPPEWL